MNERLSSRALLIEGHSALVVGGGSVEDFVRAIRVSYAGKPILTAEVDFSISENPNFRFYFVPAGDGELKAEAVDTKELKFETRFAVRRGPG